MHTAEILRWTIVSGLAAALLQLPRPTAFWSLAVSRPLVLARVAPRPARLRAARPI